MSEKKRARPATPAKEIMERAADADPAAPDTPLSGASKATTPPHPKKRPTCRPERAGAGPARTGAALRLPAGRTPPGR